MPRRKVKLRGGYHDRRSRPLKVEVTVHRSGSGFFAIVCLPWRGIGHEKRREERGFKGRFHCLAPGRNHSNPRKAVAAAMHAAASTISKRSGAFAGLK